MDNAIEPQELALDELRSLRNQLQHDDDALSYVRRLVQARLDLVLSERQHRISGLERSDVTEDLRAILGEHLVASGGGLPRPPRMRATIRWPSNSTRCTAVSAATT
jgi:anti-sigma-K factor RsiG